MTAASHNSPTGADPGAIARQLAAIQTGDSDAVLFFGSRPQQRLTELSQRMLDGVLDEDIAGAGQTLGQMAEAIRGFDVDTLDPNRRQGLLARLLFRPKPLQEFLHRYEDTRRRVDAVAIAMERQKTQLLTNIVSLDRLYADQTEQLQELELYIAAGDERLRRLDEEQLPALEREAAESGQALGLRQLEDLRNARDDLQRRLHDLRLSRQVALQALPSIRMVQDNSKDLVAKIDSTLANTLPLWRQQLALVIAIFRTDRAARAGAIDRELVTSFANKLQAAGAEVDGLRSAIDLDAAFALLLPESKRESGPNNAVPAGADQEARDEPPQLSFAHRHRRTRPPPASILLVVRQ